MRSFGIDAARMGTTPPMDEPCPFPASVAHGVNFVRGLPSMLRLTFPILGALALASCSNTQPPGDPVAADVTATRFETLEGSPETTATEVKQPLVISGTIVYRERMLVPGATTVEIEILNGSTGEIIVESTIDNAGQIPIPFAVSVDEEAITRLEKGTMTVRLLGDGRPFFATPDPVPVIEAGKVVWPPATGGSEVVLRRGSGS